MTIADALRDGAERLETAGVPSPRLDAERLLRHVLGWDAARLIAAARDSLPVSAAVEYEALVAQRADRRPLQHLTGTQAFWKHDFLVTPDVLIPRPETELLVEAALQVLRDTPSPVVVDVGTGSGCIAVSLALERTDAQVVGVDSSAAALFVARANAERLGARVRLEKSDLLAAVPELEGRVDVVVSNPPYVDPAEIPGLEPEVRDHEPRGALVPDEGCDAIYTRLAREAARALKPGGTLAVEMGAGMEVTVRCALTDAGLRVREVRQDLAGIPRVVIATRP
jgi:release factor glutamine methyltransferase